MSRVVTVHEVWEKNDCSGRKQITIASQESDETVFSYFQLSRSFNFPAEKIDLACVSEGDRIWVEDSFGQIGEIIGIDTSSKYKNGLCRCQAKMVSDGIYVYCPNRYCGLTLEAQLERLANTCFLHPNHDSYDVESGLFGPALTHGDMLVSEIHFQKPFASIVQGSTWGYDGYALSEILLHKVREDVSVTTFLVESLFRTFMENGQHVRTMDPSALYNITRFYGNMDELIYRRDFQKQWQHQLLTNFLWSLGIEALSYRHIGLMIQYEQSLGLYEDPLLIHCYLLTNANEMIRELGLSPFEAGAIVREVAWRRYEFHDLFYAYVQDKNDVHQMFQQLE